MQITAFTSVDEILHDVLKACDQEELKDGFEEGWFISQIQQSMEEIEFDSFYNIVTRDLPLDKANLRLDVPKNAFNLREIYLFNGDCCDPSDSQIVHLKRLHNNKGIGKNYTSKTRQDGGTNTDPYFGRGLFRRRQNRAIGIGEALQYANYYNGVIMFGPDAEGFDSVRLVYNGISADIGDEPIIPRFFRQYVKDWTLMKYYEAAKQRDRSLRSLWADYKGNLYDRISGTYFKAVDRIAKMDMHTRESMNEYLGRFNA